MGEISDDDIMNLNKNLSELVQMLNTAEINIVEKKIDQVLMVNKGKGFKGKGKTKVANPKAKVAKPKEAPKPKEAKPKSQEDAVCFHCNEIGHWRRNCAKYKEALKKSKGVASTSGSKEQKDA